MLNWLKDKTSTARAAITAEVSKFKNREFMQGVIAGCALMANADGNVSSDEKQKMMAYVGSSDELKHFKTSDVIAYFTETLGKFEFDHALGEAEALKVIGRLRGNEEQARMLVRVVIVLAGADGNFDAKERACAARICTELGLDPNQFDI